METDLVSRCASAWEGLTLPPHSSRRYCCEEFAGLSQQVCDPRGDHGWCHSFFGTLATIIGAVLCAT